MAWANEPSITTADDSSIITPSSSLQYVNSQLVAHGYIQNPGISLEGLSTADTQRAVKCLLALLAQRIQDMERADEHNTKIRTMNYDNDRLKSMHQAALDRASNAEREMNLWKSRAAAAEKASQTSDKRFKSLTAENQRLRTTMQSLRAGAQNEIKKFEKEKDKLLERLGKIADSKSYAQFRCTNLSAVDAPENNIGGGRGYLDIALEDAENARGRLAEENDYLRHLFVGCTNKVQDVLHVARTCCEDGQHMDDEPAPVTLTMLFPLEPQNAARDKFNSILMALKETLESQTMSAGSLKRQDPDKSDIARLQKLVENLRSELDQARSHTSDYATQTQSLFDRFIEDKRLFPNSGITDMSADLMTAPARDEERERLEARSNELEKDRWKLTEAAIKLGKERAALEEQRLQFLEEQRGWEVQRVLAHLPPTPDPPAPSLTKVKKTKTMSKKVISPHRRKSKSPVKSIIAKTGVVKKALIASPAQKLTRKKAALRFAKRASDVQTLETEMISMPPPSPPPPSRETIAKMTSVEDLLASCSQGPTHLVLPTEFVLPPPSPQASLPPLPKSTSGPYAPVPQFSLNNPTFAFSTGAPPPHPHYAYPPTSMMTGPAMPSSSSNALSQPQPPPQTPGVRPFPTQNPMRMVHPYSPVKPSPLSRILMMADDSPPSNAFDGEELLGQPLPLRPMALARPSLDSLPEESGDNLVGEGTSGSGMALTVEELGVPMYDDRGGNTRKRAPLSLDDLQDEGPLKEKNTRRSPSPRKATAAKRPHAITSARPKLRSDTEKRTGTVTRDKGKGKEVEVKHATTSRTRTATVAGLDKENSAAKRLKPSPPSTSSSVATERKKRPGHNSRKAPLPPVRSSSSRTSTNKAGPPRRVPVGSSEAIPRS